LHRLVCTRPGVYRIVSNIRFSGISGGPNNVRHVAIDEDGGVIIRDGGRLVASFPPPHIDQPHSVPELPPLVNGGVEDAADLGQPMPGADERATVTD
jgi:hypothetical protein